MDYQIIDIITIVVSLLLAIRNAKRIDGGALPVLYYFFIFIYVVPLFLDYIIGYPTYLIHWDAIYNTYDKFEGFILSYQDSTTRILYDIFLLSTQIVLTNSIKKQRTSKEFESNIQIQYGSKVIRILFLFAFMPTILSLVVGYYYIPFLFGWRENPLLMSVEHGAYYSIIERFTYIGVVSSMICLLLPHRNLGYRLLMICLLYANISIESKRSILFFAMATFILLKYKGFGSKINFKQLGLLVIVLTSLMLFYSIYIKTSFRGYEGFEQLYTNVRIDMFRDDTAKLIIYSFVSNMKSIVDWPLQSYLTEISSIFPLDIMNGMFRLDIPSVGFNCYITSALTGSPISEGNRWMTTSLVDEIMANFSYVSIVIVPYLLIRLSKVIDSSDNLIQVFLLSATLLGFMYSFNYIAYFIQFVFLMLYLTKK